MEAMLSRTAIEPEFTGTPARALRHYRFGNDADTYKDKFLNWWMWASSSWRTSVTAMNYRRTVAVHASDALLQRYLYRLVSDLVRTIKGQSIAWDA